MMSWLRTLAYRDEADGALGRHSVLLASLVFLLVALPLASVLTGGTTRFASLLALVLLAAVFVNNHQRWLFGVALVIGASAIAGILGSEFVDSPALRIASDLLALLLLGFTTLVLLNSLIQAEIVSEDTIVGGICAYLLIGLCFAMVFILLTNLQPGSFAADGEAIIRSPLDTSAHATQLLYFSFVTLTNLGYGDITPVGDLAQMFSVSEALVGQLYLAIFVARLVALFVASARRR